jgi:dienelactone hydrolase
VRALFFMVVCSAMPVLACGGRVLSGDVGAADAAPVAVVDAGKDAADPPDCIHCNDLLEGINLGTGKVCRKNVTPTSSQRRFENYVSCACGANQCKEACTGFCSGGPLSAEPACETCIKVERCSAVYAQCLEDRSL